MGTRKVAAFGRVLVDQNENEVIGELQATPTSYTLLRRLKDILTGLVLAAGSNLIGKVRLVSSDGTEVTDDTANAVTSTIVDATGTDVIGAVTASPVSNTLLDRLKALKTGIILAAGTNIVGWFKRKRVPVTTNTTGTSTTLATLDPAADFQMLGIRVFFGTALASAETLTVTLDANAGVAYDIVLFTLDMGTPDIRSVVIPFEGGEDFFVSGDKIVVALSANTGSDTWGCQTIHELV